MIPDKNADSIFILDQTRTQGKHAYRKDEIPSAGFWPRMKMPALLAFFGIFILAACWSFYNV